MQLDRGNVQLPRHLQPDSQTGIDTGEHTDWPFFHLSDLLRILQDRNASSGSVSLSRTGRDKNGQPPNDCPIEFLGFTH